MIPQQPLTTIRASQRLFTALFHTQHSRDGPPQPPNPRLSPRPCNLQQPSAVLSQSQRTSSTLQIRVPADIRCTVKPDFGTTWGGRKLFFFPMAFDRGVGGAKAVQGSAHRRHSKPQTGFAVVRGLTVASGSGLPPTPCHEKVCASIFEGSAPCQSCRGPVQSCFCGRGNAISDVAHVQGRRKR